MLRVKSSENDSRKWSGRWVPGGEESCAYCDTGVDTCLGWRGDVWVRDDRLHEPTISDAPVRSWRQEVPAEGALGTVEQDGMSISISAQQVCDVRPVRLVRRTSTREAENRSAALDWLIAGLGVASVGTGAVLLADAGNTYPNDKTSRTYNPVGSGAVTAYGIGFIAAGVALGVIPIIDVVRAQETKVEVRDERLMGDVTERIACSRHPAAGATVDGQVGGRTFSLGVTDPKGKLKADLDDAIDGAFVPTSGAQMRVSVNGAVLDSVSLAEVRSARDQRAWSSVELEKCQAAVDIASCESVKRYLSAYPDGQHAGEARQLMAASQPKLTKLADDQRWTRVNVQACTRQKFDWANEIREACTPVSEYLAEYPDGEHAKAARAALQQGMDRADALDLTSF
jgi:hypothetical protein